MRRRRTFKVWLGHQLLTFALGLIAVFVCLLAFIALISIASTAAATR